MIKHLIVLAVVIVTSAKAQTLTVQQAFNFNVGDVFYKQYSCGNAMFAFDSVTTKTYSPNNDTIFYNFSRVQKNYTAGQQNGTTTYTNYILTVTNLNSPVSIPAFSGTDTLRTDTVFTAYCGKQVYGYKYKCVAPCPSVSINKIHQLVFYIDGLGGPYEYSSYTGAGGGQPCSYIADVLYYKKGNLQCGTRPTGIHESAVVNTEEVLVYPNPAKNEITINIKNLQAQNVVVEFFDASGRLVKSIKIRAPFNVNLDGFSTGIYLMKITSDSFTVSKKISVN